MRLNHRAKQTAAAATALSLVLGAPGLPAWQAFAQTVHVPGAAGSAVAGPANGVAPGSVASPVGPVVPAVPVAPVAPGSLTDGLPAGAQGQGLSAAPAQAGLQPSLQQRLEQGAKGSRVLSTIEGREGAALPQAASEEPASPARALAAPKALESLPRDASLDDVRSAAAREFDASFSAGAAPRVRAPSGPRAARAAATTAARPASTGVLPKRPHQAVRSLADTAKRRSEGSSMLFPAALAGVAASVGAALVFIPKLAGWAATQAGGLVVTPQHLAAYWAANTGLAVLGLAAVIGAYWVYEAGVYAFAAWKGKAVTKDEFWTFVEQDARKHPELYRGLLGTGRGSGLLKPVFEKQNRIFGVFAYTLPGGIYVRPELVRVPWEFRRALRQELRHFNRHLGRGPPAPGSWIGRLWKSFVYELTARIRDFFPGTPSLPHAYILDRALSGSQISLRLTSPYDVLVAGGAGSIDAEDFEWLSGGAARVTRVAGKDAPAVKAALEAELAPYAAAAKTPRTQLDMLRALLRGELEAEPAQTRAPRYRAILLQDPAAWAPQGKEAKLLEKTFERMELLYQERVAQARRDTQERKLPLTFGLWNAVETPTTAKLPIAGLVEKLYRATRDKGVVLLPFKTGDPALGWYQKVFSHWAAGDGGTFRVSRVDLGEGGHVLVAEKVQPRVRLFLSPANGKTVASSILNIYRDPVKSQAADAVVRHLGLDSWLGVFRSIDLEYLHILGQDQGDTRLFVSVPRSALPVIRDLAAAEQAFRVERAVEDFQPMSAGVRASTALRDAVPRLKAPQAFKHGQGEGGIIYVADTGIDKEHEAFDGLADGTDFMDEGLNDYQGHGTHTGHDAHAFAPKARIHAGKVFARGRGAANGDIEAAWAEALQIGADVTNSSLGSPGLPSSDPLARHASGMTRKRNSKGDLMIMVGSYGNSGPSDDTGGSPASGEEVIAVAAATKGETDGVVDMALYSSGGHSYYDHGAGLRRPVMKPEITAIGGNVNTPDAKGDLFSHGVIAARSRDSEPGPSDEPGGLYTKKSGTSMSGPEVAGAALLVKQAAVRAAKGDADAEAFLKEHLPFAVKAVLMASAEDMWLPAQRQGAGLLDVEAAVKLAGESLKRGADGKPGWDWILRARAAVDAPKAVFERAVKAHEDTLAANAGVKGRIARAAADKARFEAFRDGRAEARERIVAGLSDASWLVRFYSAFALVGLKDAGAVEALAKAATSDADARVRQMALQALAELPLAKSMDAARDAMKDARGDVKAYAAIVLARRAEPEGVKALLELAGDADKRVRYTAAWALGRAKTIGSEGAERLAAVVRDSQERDGNRHAAIAALRRVAANEPAAFSPKVFEDVLAGSGPDDLIVTMTVLSLFSDAAGSPALRQRMTEAPAKAHLVAFVQRYSSYAGRGGPLGKLVQLLARITDTRLPRAPGMDPSGEGVPGVDENLGPIHMVVELPQGRAPARTVSRPEVRVVGHDEFERDEAAENAFAAALESAGLPMDALQQLGASVRMVMKEGFVTLDVPGYSSDVLAMVLGQKGFLAERAGPQAMFMRDTGPATGLPELHRSGHTGKGTLMIINDEGIQPDHEAFLDKMLAALSTVGGDVSDEDYGHGTHVANTSGGQQRPDGNPNIGRAPDTLFVAAKSLGRSGGSMATVMEAMSGAVQKADDANAELEKYWKAKDAGQEPALPENKALRKAIAQGTRRLTALANLSLGGPGKKDNPLNLLLRKLMLTNKVKVSVAAGNDGPGRGAANRTSPANEWSVPAIAAAQKDGAPAPYSSEGTDDEPVIRRTHYGGSVNMDGGPSPFLPGGIVSALAAKAAGAAAGSIVQHNGKDTDQAMSGTSMASPHNAGDDALVVEVLRTAFTPEEIEATPGLFLWIDAHADRNAKPIEGAPAYKVGAGLRDVAKEIASLKELLKDKAAIVKEAAELHQKAVERDRRESVQRWAPVADSPTPEFQRPVWAAVASALARPWKAVTDWLARVSRRAASKASTGALPAPEPARPGYEEARDWARLKQVRELLSSGAPVSGGRVQPFVFHTKEGLVESEDAGLEGFLWTKSRIEARLGTDAVLHHLGDAFAYLDAVLSAREETRSLASELRALRDEPLEGAEKNARLNALVSRAVSTLRAEEARLDRASWAHGARVYELFPRAYDPAGRRKAAGGVAGAVQKAIGLLERAGLRKPRKFFADFGYVDLWLIKRMGFDTVWTMGIHPIGVVGRWGTGGGSPYAIRDHRAVHEDLGTLEEYRALVARAHRMGLKVVADFVPNHVAMDSALLAEHPEWFVTRERRDGEAAPSVHWYAYTHAATGRKLWVHHGGFDWYGSLDTWKDTAQVDYSNEAARRGMAGVAAGFARATGVDGYRVDMAYQLLNHTFARNWGKAMPAREWLEELAFELKARRPDFALIAEAYADHEHLSRAGFDLVYNKSEHGRQGERGFWEALKNGDAGQLERALDRVAFLSWRRGGASGLQFATNHDEPAPRRAFGARVRGALMLSLLLPGAHLVYASQETGFDRPEKHEPKAVPFSVPVTLEWEGPGVDADIAALHAELLPLAGRIRKDVPEPELTRLSGPGWVGYAVTPRAGSAGRRAYVVVANLTDKETAVSVERPDLGLSYHATLEPYDAGVDSFRVGSHGPAWRAALAGLRGALSARYDAAAKLGSFMSFWVFTPMMVPQIKINWANYFAGETAALAGVSWMMMTLGITGNLFNISAFLLSRNPWLILGCLAGIATTWVALLPLFLAGTMPAPAFAAITAFGAVVLTAAFGLRTRKSHRQ